MSTASTLAEQIQRVLQLDSSPSIQEGQVKELEVSTSPLLCPICGHIETSTSEMMMHLFACAKVGTDALKKYQRYSLAPAKVAQLLRDAQSKQVQVLLVPVKGLKDQHLQIPVTTPVAHLVLGGSTVSLTCDRSYSYEYCVKNTKLYINAYKYIENQLVLESFKSSK